MRQDMSTSRRTILGHGAALLTGVALTGVALAGAARADDDDGKVAKEVVQYQYKHGPDDAHCAICVNYVEPGAWKVVAGKIDPNGYCIAYGPKGA